LTPRAFFPISSFLFLLFRVFEVAVPAGFSPLKFLSLPSGLKRVRGRFFFRNILTHSPYCRPFSDVARGSCSRGFFSASHPVFTTFYFFFLKHTLESPTTGPSVFLSLLYRLHPFPRPQVKGSCSFSWVFFSTYVILHCRIVVRRLLYYDLSPSSCDSLFPFSFFSNKWFRASDIVDLTF